MLQLNEILPKTLPDLLNFCATLSKSRLIPKDFEGKQEDILVAVMKGAEIGLSPMNALESIAIINGRAMIWGDAPLALVKSSGKLQEISEKVEGSIEDKTLRATCFVKAKDGHHQTHTWTYQKAEKAGLAKKPGPWLLYPERMLQLKARAWCLRDVFPDVLKGFAIKEDYETETIVEKKSIGKGADAFVETFVEPELKQIELNPAEGKKLDDEEMAFTVDEIRSRIQSCKNQDDLDEIIDIANSFSENEKSSLRDAFRIKRAEILKNSI